MTGRKKGKSTGRKKEKIEVKTVGKGKKRQSSAGVWMLFGEWGHDIFKGG